MGRCSSAGGVARPRRAGRPVAARRRRRYRAEPEGVARRAWCSSPRTTPARPAAQPPGSSCAIPRRALRRWSPGSIPPPVPAPGVDPVGARSAPGRPGRRTSRIGPDVVLGAAVRLGARSRIDAGVVLEDGVDRSATTADIGAHVVCAPGCPARAPGRVKAGAVIGGHRFGFHRSAAGHQRIPHVGGCVIEDDVEVGSISCIDRGSLDDTVIGRGTKIDNLVHLAHNVRIGQRCLIAGGVLVGGSTRLGNVIIGGGAGIGDHVAIGDGARIGAGTGVVRDVPAGADVSGNPGAEPPRLPAGPGGALRVAAIIAELEDLVAERGSVPRRTLEREVTLTGVGLHTGVTSSVVCRPAPAGRDHLHAARTASAAVPARPQRGRGHRAAHRARPGRRGHPHRGARAGRGVRARTRRPRHRAGRPRAAGPRRLVPALAGGAAGSRGDGAGGRSGMSSRSGRPFI